VAPADTPTNEDAAPAASSVVLRGPRHWVTYTSGQSFGCRCVIGRDHSGQDDYPSDAWQAAYEKANHA